MKIQDRNIEGKSQFATHPNAEIIELLESGGREIVKELYDSRQAKSSPEVKMARKQLNTALNSAHESQELKHIQILTTAIEVVVYWLKLTKGKFHSKGLRKTREYASRLLKEVKIKYRKAKEGMPMGK